MAALLASLLGGACDGPTSVAVIPVGEKQVSSSDAGASMTLGAADSAAPLPVVTQVTLQVAGLVGSGLVLNVGPAEQYAVRADGSYTIPLTTPATDIALQVFTQPSAPLQTCELARLDRESFSLTCATRTYHVGGTVEGLTGQGLVLTSQTGESHAISASGSFQLDTVLPDGAAYAVSVGGSITGPAQACAISNGAGSVHGADVDDIVVTCALRSFFLSATVLGLKESGLTLKLGDGSIMPVAAAGTFTYPSALPDGFQYNIDIAQQPTGGAQRCYVQNGSGKIAGADSLVQVVCDVLGGLRISEVGACPYANSSCWFELINVNANHMPEQLSLYRVRTPAIADRAYHSEHTFDLPSMQIPYLGRVVVQAFTTTALPDGDVLVHTSDGSLLPWWNAGGFVELLSDSRTTDFVRFGDNTMEPTTGGAWLADATGTAAPALQTGNDGFGDSLAHRETFNVTNSPSAWAVHAFSTPGGVNDVTSDVDADADGIPDTAEVRGATFAGIDVYAMGARLGQRDVFVEVDRMDSSDAAVIPRKEALDKLVSVFKNRGIFAHYDVGSLFSPSFDPANYNLGGGNVVPFSKGVSLGNPGAGMADLYAIKAPNMAVARRSFFYYQLFAWSQQADGSPGSSGVGELPGNDSTITLGGYQPGLSAANAIQRNLLINYQAATMMHELGHNLGLRHGGSDQINRKPNYVSVMNYLYSPLGLPTIGVAEGDRYDLFESCSLISIVQLTNAPTGDVGKFVLDYSDGLSADLDETHLLETGGLGRHNSVDVDYNCNRKVDAPYGLDLNGDGAQNVLVDSDDWASLSFIFRRTWAGTENGSALRLLSPSLGSHDVGSADARRNTDEPCGQLDPALMLSMSEPASSP